MGQHFANFTAEESAAATEQTNILVCSLKTFTPCGPSVKELIHFREKNPKTSIWPTGTTRKIFFNFESKRST